MSAEEIDYIHENEAREEHSIAGEHVACVERENGACAAAPIYMSADRVVKAKHSQLSCVSDRVKSDEYEVVNNKRDDSLTAIFNDDLIMAENVQVDLDTKYRDLVRREDEACQALEDHEAQLKIIEEERVERLETRRRHLSPMNERYEALLQRERAAQLRVMAIDDGQKKRSGRAFYRSEKKVVYDTDGVIAAEVDASYAVLLLRPRVDGRIRTIHINAIIDEEGVRTHMHSELKDPQPPRRPFKLKADQPLNQPETVQVSSEEERNKATTSEAGAERSRKRKSRGTNQPPKILKNEKVDLSIQVLSKRRAFQAATERLKQKLASDNDDDEEEMTGKAEINKSRQMKSSDQDLPGKLKPTAQEQSAPTAFPSTDMSSRGSEPPPVAEHTVAGNEGDEEASQSKTEDDQQSDDPGGASQSSSDESDGSKIK